MVRVCSDASRLPEEQRGRHMGDFTKLAVWKKSHEVTLAIYRETSRWPRHELFSLTSQTRRAAVSVPANIADGCGRNNDAELARHTATHWAPRASSRTT